MAGKLEKLTLRDVDGDPSGKKSGTKDRLKGKTLAVFYNPESYRVSYAVTYSSKQRGGSEGMVMKYKKSPPKVLSFKLIFDGTGASVPGGYQTQPAPKANKETPAQRGARLKAQRKASVNEKVNAFINLAYNQMKNPKRPKRLLITWGAAGSLSMMVVLTKADITYNLFAPDGTPLRAEVSVTFKETLPTKLERRKKAKQQKQKTAEKTVENNTNVAQECHQQHGTTSTYMEVAKANDLDSVRGLKPGQKLTFPPISSLKKPSTPKPFTP